MDGTRAQSLSAVLRLSQFGTPVDTWQLPECTPVKPNAAAASSQYSGLKVPLTA